MKAREWRATAKASPGVSAAKGRLEKVGPLLNWAGALVTKDMEMAKVLNAFFILVFTGMTCLQESQAPVTHGKVWNNEELSLVEDNQVREH